MQSELTVVINLVFSKTYIFIGLVLDVLNFYVYYTQGRPYMTSRLSQRDDRTYFWCHKIILPLTQSFFTRYTKALKGTIKNVTEGWKDLTNHLLTAPSLPKTLSLPPVQQPQQQHLKLYFENSRNPLTHAKLSSKVEHQWHWK